jgi:hypothetical protein
VPGQYGNTGGIVPIFLADHATFLAESEPLQGFHGQADVDAGPMEEARKKAIVVMDDEGGRLGGQVAAFCKPIEVHFVETPIDHEGKSLERIHGGLSRGKDADFTF